jgi:hypothetical protein
MLESSCQKTSGLAAALMTLGIYLSGSYSPAVQAAEPAAEKAPAKTAAAEKPQPTYQLGLFKAITLVPGDTKTVELEVKREGYDGAIAIEFDGLPEGVTASAASIPAKTDRSSLSLTADVAAEPRVRSATIRSTGGSIKQTGHMIVRVDAKEAKHLPRGMIDTDIMKKLLEDNDKIAPLKRRGSIGGRLTTESKQKLAEFYGGTPESKEAVMRGLEWLASIQNFDGSWNLSGKQGVAEEANGLQPPPAEPAAAAPATPTEPDVPNIPTAATAFGLLPFLSEGVTHKYSPEDQPEAYKGVVEKGLIYLAQNQVRTGDNNDGNLGGGMYAHALGTIALCEAYGLSGDDRLRIHAQLALKYLLNAQHQQGGGWRYSPGQAGDLSVTSWVFLGIRSAQLTGIPVLKAPLDRAERFVDSCQAGPADAPGSQYSYTPAEAAKLSMSAAGLLTRQYLGWDKDEADLNAGCAFLMQHLPPENATSVGDIYYYYYATQVLHHVEGNNFDLWNHRIREHLMRTQEKEGDFAGSWNPKGIPHGERGGRMFATGLSLLTLQAPYRHLPMYRPIKLY